MTVAFLSRPLGRHVEQTTSAQTSYTNPKKRFYASPDAAAGQVVPTTVGEKGFSVTVSRTVTGPDGKVVHQDSFPSRYIPEDAIYLVGKGGTLPAGQPLAGLYPGYTGSSAGIDLAHWLGTPAKKKKPKKPAAGNPADGSIPGIPAGTTTPGSTVPDVTTPAQTTTTSDRHPQRRLASATAAYKGSDPFLCTSTRPGRSRPRRRRSAPSSRSARSA